VERTADDKGPILYSFSTVRFTDYHQVHLIPAINRWSILGRPLMRTGEKSGEKTFGATPVDVARNSYFELFPGACVIS
jgi:hypothetical protein